MPNQSIESINQLKEAESHVLGREAGQRRPKGAHNRSHAPHTYVPNKSIRGRGRTRPKNRQHMRRWAGSATAFVVSIHPHRFDARCFGFDLGGHFGRALDRRSTQFPLSSMLSQAAWTMGAVRAALAKTTPGQFTRKISRGPSLRPLGLLVAALVVGYGNTTSSSEDSVREGGTHVFRLALSFARGAPCPRRAPPHSGLMVIDVRVDSTGGRGSVARPFRFG